MSVDNDINLLVLSARIDPVLMAAVHRVDAVVRDMVQTLSTIADEDDGRSGREASRCLHRIVGPGGDAS